jgi:hypothetical protein
MRKVLLLWLPSVFILRTFTECWMKNSKKKKMEILPVSLKQFVWGTRIGYFKDQRAKNFWTFLHMKKNNLIFQFWHFSHADKNQVWLYCQFLTVLPCHYQTEDLNWKENNIFTYNFWKDVCYSKHTWLYWEPKCHIVC